MSMSLSDQLGGQWAVQAYSMRVQVWRQCLWRSGQRAFGMFATAGKGEQDDVYICSAHIAKCCSSKQA